MPPWPMAMPSSTAIVLTSGPIPPASKIEPATSWPRSLRWTCPGTNWVKLLAMATIGLPKSSSVMPVARHSARAPAMVRPCVEVLDRSSGIGLSLAPATRRRDTDRRVPPDGRHNGQYVPRPSHRSGRGEAWPTTAGSRSRCGPAPPGGSRAAGAVLRQVLDGALLAACALHITWTLFIQPALVRHSHHSAPSLTDARTYVLGIPLLVSLAAVGIAGVTAGRARRPRAVLALAALGVAGPVIAGMGLLIALRYGGGAVVAGVGCGYAASIALAAFAVRRAGRVVPSPIDLPGSGNVLALVPVAAAILAAIIRMAVFGGTDNVSILIATVVGSLITARQMVANSAARRYAHRLAEREAFFRDMAFTDPLTGLANRRQLMRVLDEQAVGGPACVLLAIGLDGFKSGNDLRGHDVGDAVLVEVGPPPRGNLPPSDLA